MKAYFLTFYPWILWKLHFLPWGQWWLHSPAQDFSKDTTCVKFLALGPWREDTLPEAAPPFECSGQETGTCPVGSPQCPELQHGKPPQIWVNLGGRPECVSRARWWHRGKVSITTPSSVLTQAGGCLVSPQSPSDSPSATWFPPPNLVAT